MAEGFAASFKIPGGFDKQFYTRLRELRKRYNLTDRALIESMIWFTLAKLNHETGDFPDFIRYYKSTAPSDITLPEVV